MNADQNLWTPYARALRYIASRSGYERGFVANPFATEEVVARGLLRTRALLEQLGNPDQSLRIVHIAGTKGKGSTAATIEAVARSAGIRTGLYTTPHLHSFRERIQIDRQPVSEEQFTALVDTIASASEVVERDQPEIGPPTAFEQITAMAVEAFQREQVDLAILETGLGGRFDATNVVTPAVAAITSISLDHTAILGDTPEQIAFEKAGIIKQGVPVVTGRQQPEVTATLRRIAGQRQAQFFQAGIDWSASGGYQAALFTGPWGEWRDIELSLAGAHQVDNTGIALMTLGLLDPELTSNEQRVREALKHVAWAGRFERIWSRGVEIVLDGAHNVDSIAKLVDLLEAEYPDEPKIVIFGTATDKDRVGMLRELVRLAATVIATESSNPRATPAGLLGEAATGLGLDATVLPDQSKALNAALEISAERDGVVCVTGSLYLVGDLRSLLGWSEFDSALETRILYGE